MCGAQLKHWKRLRFRSVFPVPWLMTVVSCGPWVVHRASWFSAVFVPVSEVCLFFTVLTDILSVNEHTMSPSFNAEFDLDSYVNYCSVVEWVLGLKLQEKREEKITFLKCSPIIIQFIVCFLSSYYEPRIVKGTARRWCRDLGLGPRLSGFESQFHRLSGILTTCYVTSQNY